MLIVKDSMILIHLAAGGVLREACTMFGEVIIPNAVHKEVVEKGIELIMQTLTLSKNLRQKDTSRWLQSPKLR